MEPGSPAVKLAYSAPGRLRIRVDAPRGEGKLGRLATELERMPETQSVRANHAARSVTVGYDPDQVSVVSLLSRLEQLGLIVLDLADPKEWPELVASHLVPMAADRRSVPGWLNHQIKQWSAGGLNLFTVTVAVLLISTGLQVRGALVRGQAVPWLRVMAYLLAALSIWTRHRQDSGA